MRKLLIGTVLAAVYLLTSPGHAHKGGVFLCPGLWTTQMASDGGVNANIEGLLVDAMFVSADMLGDPSAVFFVGVPIVPANGAVMVGTYAQIASPIRSSNGAWVAMGLEANYVPRQWIKGTWRANSVPFSKRTTTISLGPKVSIVMYWPMGQWLVPIKADMSVLWNVSGLPDVPIDAPTIINLSVSVPFDLFGSGALLTGDQR